MDVNNRVDTKNLAQTNDKITLIGFMNTLICKLKFIFSNEMSLIRKYVSDRKWKGLKIDWVILIEREPSKAPYLTR